VLQIDHFVEHDDLEGTPSSHDQVRQLLFNTDTGSTLRIYYTQFARRRNLERRLAGETVQENSRFLPLERELELNWYILADTDDEDDTEDMAVTEDEDDIEDVIVTEAVAVTDDVVDIDEVPVRST
jgi:hypothetical protein